MAGTAPAEQLPSERQLKKLIKVYSKALRRHPNNLDLRTKLAEVLRLLGRVEEAIALYSSVAWAHGVAGNLGQAIMLCKIILQLSPEHSDTQQMLAKLYASKRIREAKQSVPVVRSIDGRWVADPRGTQVSAASATTPPTAAEPRMVLRSPPTLPPEDDEDEDDGDEPTKNETPSNPDLVARRGDSANRPTSKELPAARRVAPPPEPLEDDVEPGSMAAADPNKKVHSPFTAAPTMLKDDPIVVRTDEEGQLVVDKSAPVDLAPEQGAFPTMQLPPTQVEKVGQVPPPAPALRPPPQEVSIEEPTRLEDAVDQEEPTQLEDASSDVPPSDGQATDQRDRRPTLERTGANRVGAESMKSAIEEAVEPRLAAVPAGQRLTTGELSGVTPGESPAPVEPAPTDVQDAPPVEPTPTDVQEPSPVAERATSRLSPSDMMERLSELMPKAHSGQFRHETIESAIRSRGTGPAGGAAPAGPPAPDEVQPLKPGESGVEAVRVAPDGEQPRPRRRTSPGFLSGADRQESARDPLRFIRTTRRYATIEDDEGAVGANDTLADQIDPNLVSAVVRMDGMSQADHQSPTKGYSAIQKEVRQAGNAQEDGEPNAEETAEAERSLLDTIRELPEEIDPGADVSLPKVPYPLFSDLDTPAFLAMVEKLERRVCPAGSLVFQEGDPGDSLFLISSGSLEVLKADEKGRLIELARLGPGSFFGEFGLLTDRHRHASVRTVDEAELLELRRDVLEELIHEHPSISWTLSLFYQQRLMAMVLATSPLFQAVKPPERKEVLSRFAIKRIMEGELIIEEGKPGTGFYVILVGEVSVTCTSDDGAQIPLGILAEGDYFGEISLLTGTAAEASVRANAITEVLTLSVGDFYDLASTHPEIWAEVQEAADRRQRETAQRLAEQARRVKAAGPLCLI